jgi:hypothetical protein
VREGLERGLQRATIPVKDAEVVIGRACLRDAFQGAIRQPLGLGQIALGVRYVGVFDQHQVVRGKTNERARYLRVAPQDLGERSLGLRQHVGGRISKYGAPAGRRSISA